MSQQSSVQSCVSTWPVSLWVAGWQFRNF